MITESVERVKSGFQCTPGVHGSVSWPFVWHSERDPVHLVHRTRSKRKIRPPGSSQWTSPSVSRFLPKDRPGVLRPASDLSNDVYSGKRVWLLIWNRPLTPGAPVSGWPPPIMHKYCEYGSCSIKITLFVPVTSARISAGLSVSALAILYCGTSDYEFN